jgi:PhnB protein
MKTQENPTTGSKTKTTTLLVPHLCCRNAADAVEFYRLAFGADIKGVYKTPDGRVMHASLEIDGAMFYVVDEFPECGGLGPESIGNSPVTLHLQVANADDAFERAVEAGCQVVMPLQDMFWGDRYGMVTDPYGHKWSIATTIREVSPEELQRTISSMPEFSAQ